MTFLRFKKKTLVLRNMFACVCVPCHSQRQTAASRRRPFSGGKQVGKRGCRTQLENVSAITAWLVGQITSTAIHRRRNLETHKRGRVARLQTQAWEEQRGSRRKHITTAHIYILPFTGCYQSRLFLVRGDTNLNFYFILCLTSHSV